LWSTVWGKGSGNKLRYVNIPLERVSTLPRRGMANKKTRAEPLRNDGRGGAGKRSASMVNIRGFIFAVSIAALLAAASGPARAARGSRALHPVKAPAQVDAIVDNVVDRLWDRADWYWHEGRYEERVAVDRLIIRMDPHFIEPYGTAGWLLESLGRDQEALELYRQAVAAVPTRWETHHDLGMYYYQHKDFTSATTEFQQATQQPGAPEYVWKMLAHAYERSGALEQAVSAWEAAARVAPNDPAIAVNLSRVRARLNASTKG
jgi:tetratricopeptide (TPR) repeat protein